MMRINEALTITPEMVGILLLSTLAGAILSILYFGGLWLTVQRMERVRQPALLFASSYLLRMALLLGGLFLISGGRLERLAASMLGFFITRQIFLKWVRNPDKTSRSSSLG